MPDAKQTKKDLEKFTHQKHLSLLTNQQSKLVDQQAISEQKINSTWLMKNAAHALFSIIQKQHSRSEKILILAGPGNNGGDAYALAFLLTNANFNVVVASDFSIQSLPDTAAHFAKKWQKPILQFKNANPNNYDLIIDGIFGAGLNKTIDQKLIDYFDKINTSKTPTIAIDLPSGINGNTGQIMGAAIKANTSITFFRPKIGHYLLPGKNYAGHIITKPIGILNNTLEKIQPKTLINHPGIWLDRLPKIKTHDHKYTRGITSIIGGNTLSGAACLAAQSASFSGAGLVRIFCQNESKIIYQSQLTDALIQPFESALNLMNTFSQIKTNVLLIGPGLIEANNYLDFTLEASQKGYPLVLDASILTAFSQNITKLSKIAQAPVVLTPHLGEFKRLFPNIALENKLEATKKASKASNAIIVLKGSDTIIASPDGFALINHNGCKYLSTAGTGDVLSGVIASLMAQKMPPFLACAAASFFHNEAGHFLQNHCVAQKLPEAIARIQSRFQSS